MDLVVMSTLHTLSCDSICWTTRTRGNKGSNLLLFQLWSNFFSPVLLTLNETHVGQLLAWGNSCSCGVPTDESLPFVASLSLPDRLEAIAINLLGWRPSLL